MSFYLDARNVEDYIDMAKGFNGEDLISVLKQYLVKDSSVLEIGMGPGVDYELLSEYFNVLGTDFSPIFIERYKSMHPDANVCILNAITMDIDQKFDGIYSNKVLMHFEKNEMIASLVKQKKMLNNGGIMVHSLWKGTTTEAYDGLRFVYYTEEILRDCLEGHFEILEIQSYKEMEEDDSIFIVLR